MKIKYSFLAFSIAAMAFLFLSVPTQKTAFAAGISEPCATNNECNTSDCQNNVCYCDTQNNACLERHTAGGQCDNDAMCQVGLVCTNNACAQPNQQPQPNQNNQQNAGGGAVQQLPNPLGTTDVSELIARVIKAALGLVGSVGLLMFLYGGFTWMTAGGNDKKVEQGKQVLTWAVLGLIVIFTSYAVLSFVIERLTTSTSGNNIEQNQPQP